MNDRNAPRRTTLTINRDKPQHKPRAWNHQDDLKALRGKKIIFRLREDVENLTGVLIDADQFTLKLEYISSATGNKSTLTYFKHALEFYGAA